MSSTGDIHPRGKVRCMLSELCIIELLNVCDFAAGND